MSTLTCYEFFSQTCAPCKRLDPIITRLADEYKVNLIKIDVEVNQAATTHYGVRGIPTLILEKNGKFLRRITGGISEKKLREFLSG